MDRQSGEGPTETDTRGKTEREAFHASGKQKVPVCRAVTACFRQGHRAVQRPCGPSSVLCDTTALPATEALTPPVHPREPLLGEPRICKLHGDLLQRSGAARPVLQGCVALGARAAPRSPRTGTVVGAPERVSRGEDARERSRRAARDARAGQSPPQWTRGPSHAAHGPASLSCPRLGTGRTGTVRLQSADYGTRRMALRGRRSHGSSRRTRVSAPRHP